MNCDNCSAEIEDGEERELRGRILCEDCYMDALSPAKACDPWAVLAAKTFGDDTQGAEALTGIQLEILRVLCETGGVEKDELLERIGGGWTQKEIEREFATLRHMEKARAEKRGDRIFLRAW